MPYVDGDGDEGDAQQLTSRMPILNEDPGEAPLLALRSYMQRLRDLRPGGLMVQTQFVLLRTYVNGSVVHLQLANHTSAAWCDSWNTDIVTFLEEVFSVHLDQHQSAQGFLPLSSGGLGRGSAWTRRSSACLGSWEQCLAEVDPLLGTRSASGFFTSSPSTARSLEDACASIRAQGVHVNVRWEQRLRRAVGQRQKHWTKLLHESARERLLHELPENGCVEFRSAGGKGAANVARRAPDA